MNGPSVIDRVVARYRDTRRRVEVPEWDVVLYFGPLTKADILAVEQRMRDEDGKEPDKHRHEKNILLIVQKAELEDGSKAFRWGDRHTLFEKAEAAVLDRLLLALYSGVVPLTREGVEEGKDGSEATPTSTSG
ncbi:MAG TPA: hypothetical protein VF188_00475 [Longimicrobiales bacterium]